jgi:ribosomal protein L11 methyltransferase
MNDPGRRPRPGPEANRWTKVVIDSRPAEGEEIAVFLAELTGGGVEHGPRSGIGEEAREQVIGYLGDPCLYPSQAKELEAFLRRLGEDDPDGAPKIIGREPVPEEDWQRTWRVHFQTGHVTPRLVVKPPWEEYVPLRDEHVIEIDPGMAFGTGLHASTRLTLSFIDDLYPKTGTDTISPGKEGAGTFPPFPEKVLDVGTGTGILSMACVLLGAKEVFAIDIDPRAVAAAKENILRNELAESIIVKTQELAAVDGSFGLITANILFNTLVVLAPELAVRLDPGGTLLCAGILAGEQQEQLREVFEGQGLTWVEERTEGDWAALRLDRR